MKRKSVSTLCINIFMLIGLLLSVGCGGGGGNGGTTPPTIKSGDLVWSQADNPSGSFDEAFGMAKDANALYVVGYDQIPGHSEWRIEKRNLIDGTLTNGFGNGGVISGVTATRSVANAIAIDSTSMYVVGYDFSSGSQRWRIEKRSLSDGSLVPSFGTSGVVSSGTVSTNSVANGIAIDSSSMYVAGYDTTIGNNREWRIEKRDLITGATVSTFGTNGVITNTHVGARDDEAHGIAVDATALYVVGYDSVDGASTYAWRIEKRDITSGATVTTVRSNANPYGCDAVPYAIAVDTSNMYVVGYDITGDCSTSNWYYEWKIEKRDLNGVAVNSFGSNGVAVTNLSSLSSDAIPYAIAIDANNMNMYVAGYDSNTSTGDEQWRIEKRNLADGSLVPSFGAEGVATSNANLSSDVNILLYNEARATVTDDTYLYSAGFDMPSVDTNDEWRIEKRVK